MTGRSAERDGLRAPPAWPITLFWLLPAAIATLGLWLVPSRLNPDLSLWQLFVSQLLMWFSWGVWTALILTLGGRAPFDLARPGRSLLIYLPLLALVVGAQILLVHGIGRLFGISEQLALESILLIGVRSYGDLFAVVFCGIVGVQVALRMHAAWRAQALLNARLGQDLAEAQLRALQSQLNPHFLFNALNGIVTLIEKDRLQAQRMVVRLADLLRATLKAGERQEVPLAQELDITARYLEIEQARFADRLDVVWEVSAPGDALVPAFALQPLVENAIVHGIAPAVGGGTVRIGATPENGRLLLTVADTRSGEGRRGSNAGGTGAGVGLANLRARLARLYGGEAELVLVPHSAAGTTATLRIPLRLVERQGPARRSEHPP